MDIIKAREILNALAQGIDPITGEVLPDNHVCNQAEIIRAFYEMLKATEAKSRKQNYENAGKHWTAEADEELKKLFKKGESVYKLSKHFGRSKTAINVRLARLGLIEDDFISQYPHR